MTTAHTTGTATSRAHQLRPATRKATKARLAISGASGSGKTWTALSIAEVLAPGGRYVVIDTEPSDDNNTAAELYSDRFAFELIDWTQPPYDPRDLSLTIRELGDSGIDVLVVDSGSPFWRGQGGTLSIADGRFGGWRTASPAQDGLIDAILRAPFHVIFCTRAKMAYAVEEGQGGKQTVRKLGMEPIQRDDLEYEFQVVAMIDGEHRIDIGKTRCADLAGLSFPANEQHKLAQIYRDWLARGLQLITQTDADLLVAAFANVHDDDDRKRLKADFVQLMGVPTSIERDSLGAAWNIVTSLIGVPEHPFTPAPDDPHRCEACSLGVRAGWHSEQSEASAPLQEPAGTQEPTAPAKPADDDVAAETDDETPKPTRKRTPRPTADEQPPLQESA